MLAPGPRYFPAALPDLRAYRRARTEGSGRYELLDLGALHRGSMRTDAGNTATVLLGFVIKVRGLTLCRHQSCCRPGPARRSCRTPPSLLLCVEGGGPRRHTQSRFSCPHSAWTGTPTPNKCFEQQWREQEKQPEWTVELLWIEIDYVQKRFDSFFG